MIPESHDGPPDFADRLLDAQASQHRDRQEVTRELITEVKSMAAHVGIRFDRLEYELHNKPGKLEVRAVMCALLAVFVVMLLSFLESKGVDTSGRVRDAQQMLGPSMHLMDQAAPVSADAPADGQHLTP